MRDYTGPLPGPQTLFHSNKADICVYGGQAGGGKSVCLVAEPLRHVHNPEFTGVLLRQSNPQIIQSGGLWDKTKLIYGGRAKPFKSDPRHWEFPSGATITLRHFDDESAIIDFQGSEIPYFGFDELTHFSYNSFQTVAFSRGRSTSGVKPYIRAGCNPDPDHFVAEMCAPWIDLEWEGTDEKGDYLGPAKSGEIRYFRVVDDKISFVSPDFRYHIKGLSLPAKTLSFVHADVWSNTVLIEENPEYIVNLLSLTMVEQQQLLYGNWKIRVAGNTFKREWWNEAGMILHEDDLPPYDELEFCRAWDLAATEMKKNQTKPDFTASCLMAFHAKTITYYILDMTIWMETPGVSEKLILDITKEDAKMYGRYGVGGFMNIRMEQEPGATGVFVIDHFKDTLSQYGNFEGFRSSGSKVERSKPLSADAYRRKVKLKAAPWNDEIWFKYAIPFPKKGVKDDPVDAATLARQQFSIQPDFGCMVPPAERMIAISQGLRTGSKSMNEAKDMIYQLQNAFSGGRVD